MNAAYIVIPWLVAVGVTALFIIPVTLTLELMVSSFSKQKWIHGIPIMIGVAIAGPAMYLAKAFGMALPNGIPFIWVVFLIALMLSCLGTWIGAYILGKNGK